MLWSQVALWRVCCRCGWTGSERLAVADAQDGSRDCPEDCEDRVFLAQWHAHAAPYAALFELGELADFAGRNRSLDGCPRWGGRSDSGRATLLSHPFLRGC